MKVSFVLIIGAVFAHTCLAAEVEKFYYVGEMKLSSEAGQPIGSQVILAEKTHDPAHDLIVERATDIRDPGLFTAEERESIQAVAENLNRSRQ